jgi:hypothetical protein
MLHYNVILHVPVLHLILSYIFLFGICVALKQKISVHITVILIKGSCTVLTFMVPCIIIHKIE